MAGVERIVIKGASVYDPAQEWRAETRDLYLADGRISPPFPDADLVINADGRAVMAGGIDPYCAAAAPGQPLARLTLGQPSADEIGRLYARMGYVHVHHPFTTLLSSGFVHRCLGRIPYLDTSTCAALDLRDMGLSIKANKPEEFCEQARALMTASGAIGLFLPFPFLRHKQMHYMQKNLSAAKVLGFLGALEDPDLFPIHLWGLPGLFKKEIPNPERFHVAGLGLALDSGEALNQALAFLEAGGSADLGLSAGGEQSILVSDHLRKTGSVSLDAGLQAPLILRREELPLDGNLARNGWALLQAASDRRLALGAAGPGGGQFGPAPDMAAWLLQEKSRPEEVRVVFPREGFDPYDWARLTRTEPARILGFDDTGHLRVGARANVAVYDWRPGTERETLAGALSDCWCLIKDGIRLREEGAFTDAHVRGRTRRRELRADLEAQARTDLFRNPTLRHEHLGPLSPGDLPTG
jgi:formylmethanofuran dehydrogenase subunit A